MTDENATTGTPSQKPIRVVRRAETVYQCECGARWGLLEGWPTFGANYQTDGRGIVRCPACGASTPDPLHPSLTGPATDLELRELVVAAARDYARSIRPLAEAAAGLKLENHLATLALTRLDALFGQLRRAARTPTLETASDETVS